MDKAHWPNKWFFILAAVGSAAGLGNIWRFPFLAYEHGGGAFLLAIIIANIFIGVPLLILEIALGQKTQRGAVGSLIYIKKWARYIGWTALVLGFFILAYYTSVIGWGISYFISSFDLAWGDNAKDFFFNTTLNISEGAEKIGGVNWKLFGTSFIAWVLIYLSVRKGIKSISTALKWTAILPFIIITILAVRSLTLTGAWQGLSVFLIPNWSSLASPELWLAAFSQVFFSLSIALGIMIAYGSFRRSNAEITKSAILIAIGDFMVSFLSGIVIFGTLGYMAHATGASFSEVVTGGPSLAFVVFPTAIKLLPALNTLVAVLFFGTLSLLGISSAFSILETFIRTLSNRYPNISTKKIAFRLTILGIFMSILFVTRAGLYYLEIVDHFIVNYGIVIIGILEAIIVGWFFNNKKLIHFINERSVWKIGTKWILSIKLIVPLFLTTLLIWNIVNELKAPYGDYPGWALLYIGILPVIASPVIGKILDKFTTKTKIEN